MVLAACGGGGQSSGPTAKTSAVVPASVPVAASNPDPATSAVASTPVSASAPAESNPEPAASAPVAASSPEPASTPIAAPVPASTPIVQIDVYGDDGIAGYLINEYGMQSAVSPNEPQALQTLLQAQFNDTGITVTNHATGGTSSSLKNEMLGMDGNGAPFADRIKNSPASIVIENHTLNDALGGETVDDYRQYLAAWVVAVKAAGKIPVLEESIPVCDGDHPQLAAYVQAMDDAAAAYDIALISQYAYLQTVPNYCAHLTAGVDPDEAISAIKAQREGVVISPLVVTVEERQ